MIFFLPYSRIYLNYSKFSIKIKQNNLNSLPLIIKNISQSQIRSMTKELRKAAETFRFRFGEAPKIGDGFFGTFMDVVHPPPTSFTSRR